MNPRNKTARVGGMALSARRERPPPSFREGQSRADIRDWWHALAFEALERALDETEEAQTPVTEGPAPEDGPRLHVVKGGERNARRDHRWAAPRTHRPHPRIAAFVSFVFCHDGTL